MPVLTKLTREMLEEMNACSPGMKWFDERTEGGDELDYPGGFGEDDIQRLGRDKPFILKWLAKRGLIPGFTLTDARRVVHELHPEKFPAPKSK